MTPDEIRGFQTRQTVVDGVLGPPCDWLGKLLDTDGELGLRTLWAMAIARLDPRRQAIVRRACSKIGEAETVANRGPWPDFVLRRCGVYVPDDPTVPMPENAWCAAHASWCMSVDGLPERKEASARNLAAALRRPTYVLPGDFGWYPTGPQHGHFFPIVGIGPGEVATAEGNHNNRVDLVRRRTTEIQVVTAFPVEELAGIPAGLELVPVQAAGTR